jgi:hypothetical protein
MMYVLVTAEESRVVLIDEPQSFLHPSAVRRLFGAFKLLPKHQFIVSTHSPQAISAADPVNVTVVRRSEAESVLDNLDMQLNGSQRFLLDELGASLGDVFGADSILWVEGATEGVCFPRILQKISKRSLLGTIIKPMRATGDATGKHAAVVLDIYKKMSAGVGLIPVFLGFLFDREERGPQEIAELVRASEGLFRFLDRRAYENYLLNPTAISGTINKVHPEVEPVSDSEVATLIAELRHEAKYFHPLPLAESDWKSTIHAGKLLKEVFWRLRSLDYRKTTHSVALTDWLICNEPADLKELAGELDSILIR